jgi:hypothetical protein
LENLVEHVVQRWLFKFIVKEVQKVSMSTIPQKLNQEILDFGTTIEFEGFGFDFSLVAMPVVKDGLNIKLNATFFSEKDGKRTYGKYSSPLFPKAVEDTVSHGYTFVISQASLDSLMSVLASG